jgi:hypothetical protein
MEQEKANMEAFKGLLLVIGLNVGAFAFLIAIRILFPTLQ